MPETRTTTFAPTARHAEAHGAIVAALKRYADLPSIELLAIAAHVVGQLVALQDQRQWTPDEIMVLVGNNIEAGNLAAIAEVNAAGGARH